MAGNQVRERHWCGKIEKSIHIKNIKEMSEAPKMTF